MNPYLELVEKLQDPGERYRAARGLSAGGRGSRENRGKRLPAEKIDALLSGLEHPNPLVRRCCLEILDQHPEPRIIPHLLDRLEDPVPRVRWHAVHALLCDVCKAGDSLMSPKIAERLQEVASKDPSVKVRTYAARALAERSGVRPSARHKPAEAESRGG